MAQTEAVLFKQLRVSQWQQFESVEIDFHDRLTILTGANGSGKTTLLNILAKHASWEHTPLATPKQAKGGGPFKFLFRMFRGQDKSDETAVGSITYTNGAKSPLTVTGGAGIRYQMTIPSAQGVNSLFIPSHRPVFRYVPLENISTAKKDRHGAFQEVFQSTRNIYQGGGGHPATYFMKSALVGWVVNGYGVTDGTRYVMAPDHEQVRHFEGFQEVLRKILPASLGFDLLEVRQGEIVFVCNRGDDEFLIETASGGVSALIDMAWQIFMFTQGEANRFCVLIDEAENHLHPTMQRRLLQDLVNAFPHVQFVISTHSPLVVSSVRDSTVYALRYNEHRKIVSAPLDLANRAKNAVEILDEVLEVSTTMPTWAENELAAVVARYASKALEPEDFARLRQDLAQIGLEKLLPSAITSVLGSKA